MGASLGTESLIVMDLPRENSTDTSYRNVGFFIGSDNIQISTSTSSFPRWPVLCGDVESVCTSTSDIVEDSSNFPRICECKVSPAGKEIVPLYDVGLWWAAIALALIATTIALYASITAGYNGVTKPTQEILSVRAVLYGFVAAIGFSVLSIILCVVIFFTNFKNWDTYEEDGIAPQCPVPSAATFDLPPQIPNLGEKFSCENAALGLSFYFQLIAAACWTGAILFGYLSQRGFKSIDENSKFDTQNNAEKHDSMMF